ncbi:MAG: YgfZ/GcvT domain-containing protein [Acidimicrobiales bacterium]
MSATWWAPLERDIVLITGDDARDYLQGQISQDLGAIAPGASAWSFVLAPQGKVDAWFRLHARTDGTFIADLDAGFGETFVERIERFRLRVDVHLERLEWQYASLRGPSVSEPDVPDGGVVAAVDWPGFSGFDVMGPAVVAPADVDVVGPEVFEYTRVAAGWPVMGRELTEKTIPAEAGIGESSVSFTKGCYTGQELVARIDSRGNNTPRRLCRLQAESTLDLAVGAEVSFEGAAVGTVTSAAPTLGDQPSVALAYLHRKVEVPATVDVGGIPASAVDG